MKMLDEDNFLSIKYLNIENPKYDDECKNIISYVKIYGNLSAEGLLSEFGQPTMLRYVTLCNAYRKKKEDEQRLKWESKIKNRIGFPIKLDPENLNLDPIINDCPSINKLNQWLDYFNDKPWFTEDMRKELTKQVYKKLGV